MRSKIRWITKTAIMMTLLIVLQLQTKPFGQIVTGSCVNAVLAISVLAGGLYTGITIALFSPIIAFLVGIAPNVIAVPVIIVGNITYVATLNRLTGKRFVQNIVAVCIASAAKFVIMYFCVCCLIGGLFFNALQNSGLLNESMLHILSITFSWPQLITALIGGGVSLVIMPVLNKSLNKQ